jgi:hypothetical protein
MVELYLHSPIRFHDIVLNYEIQYRDPFIFYIYGLNIIIIIIIIIIIHLK